MGTHILSDTLTQPQIVMDSLRRIVQALRESTRQSERLSGPTPAQLLVLKRIEEQDGLSVNELAALTFTHQSTVSEIVGRLETRGLLRRERAELTRAERASGGTRRRSSLRNESA